MIEIKLKRKHFTENQQYSNVKSCPIALCMQEILGCNDIMVGSSRIARSNIIMGQIYPSYRFEQFEEDSERINVENIIEPNQVIRTFTYKTWEEIENG